MSEGSTSPLRWLCMLLYKCIQAIHHEPGLISLCDAFCVSGHNTATSVWFLYILDDILYASLLSSEIFPPRRCFVFIRLIRKKSLVILCRLCSYVGYVCTGKLCNLVGTKQQRNGEDTGSPLLPLKGRR